MVSSAGPSVPGSESISWPITAEMLHRVNEITKEDFITRYNKVRFNYSLAHVSSFAGSFWNMRLVYIPPYSAWCTDATILVPYCESIGHISSLSKCLNIPLI